MGITILTSTGGGGNGEAFLTAFSVLLSRVRKPELLFILIPFTLPSRQTRNDIMTSPSIDILLAL